MVRAAGGLVFVGEAVARDWSAAVGAGRSSGCRWGVVVGGGVGPEGPQPRRSLVADAGGVAGVGGGGGEPGGRVGGGGGIAPPGPGGLGGGATGGGDGQAPSGIANTGGGGGGGMGAVGRFGGNGGSGVVLIRYKR